MRRDRMRLAQDCVGAWVVGISLPDSFGVVPTPGTHKGPTAPPCHPVPLHIGKPPRHQATARRATIKAHPAAPPHPRPYVHNRRCANKLCAYGVLPMLFVTLRISSVIGRR